LIWLPGYLLFGYLCTFVKIWALLTCWNSSWATSVPTRKSESKDLAVPIATKVLHKEQDTVE
jgi:hypothetical protein